MVEVNVHDAETRLPEILKRAIEGEEVVISCGEEGDVRLVPVSHANDDEYAADAVLATVDDREFNHYMG